MSAQPPMVLSLEQRLLEITRKADKVARFMVHKFKAQASEDAGVARVSIQARWLEWKVEAERKKFTPVEWDPSNAHWVYDKDRDAFDWSGFRAADDFCAIAPDVSPGMVRQYGWMNSQGAVATEAGWLLPDSVRCAAPPKPVDRA